MPQVFQVLRCYKCMVFQVHQVKKAIKWECKMCGEKQSRKRNYGMGTAKDCRGHVQKLNGIRGDEVKHYNTDDEEYESPEENKLPKLRRPLKSKWSNYVEDTKEEVVEDIPSYINDTEVVLDIPKKKPKKNFEPPTKTKNKAVDSWKPIELDPSACSTAYDLKMSLNTDNTFESNIPINIKSYSNEQNLYEKKSATEKKSTFVPPKVTTNSKWADFVEDDDQCNDENYVEHDKSNTEYVWNNQTNIMHDDINDFIDLEQEQASVNGLSELSHSSTKERNDANSIVTKSNSKKVEAKPTSIFTLCDDTDLDNVLDF